MSINQFYFSQKACQSLQLKGVFETKIVFLLGYFFYVTGNPCFKGIPIHNDLPVEGFVKFKRIGKFRSFWRLRIIHAQKNVHSCTFFCA